MTSCGDGPARGGGPADEGFASVLLVAGVAVLLLVFAGAVAVADLVGAGTRARTAADLAALAAAGSAAQGQPAACARATVVARDNGARVVSCRIGSLQGPFDSDVVVSVGAAGPLLTVARHLGLDPPIIRARALAGPARS